MSLKLFLRIFGGVAIVLTLLPFIAIDYWWIRVFDFPHFQLTILTLMALAAYFLRFTISSKKDIVFVIALSACFIFQFIKIWPYTALAKYEVLENQQNNIDKNIKIFTANVFQENEDRQTLLKEIKKYDADLLLFTETNTVWQKALIQNLSATYSFKKEIPLDNTYGMCMYSKFPLINPSVQFMVEDSIPSIHTKVLLPSGDTIQVYSIHPTPPMPQHNPSSTDRDAEMIKIAFKSRESKYPVIIVGDFNDVAWSQTTELFQQVSGLLDIRKGRGFYNTYHAKYFILRWPLDHIFVSEHFRAKRVERGEKFGSDHFPIFAELSLELETAAEQKADPASEEQVNTAREQIRSEKKHE